MNIIFITYGCTLKKLPHTLSPLPNSAYVSSSLSIVQPRPSPKWKSAHYQCLSALRRGDDAKVLLLGDSLVRRLNGYVNVSGLRVVNGGYGGDTASNVRWRVQDMRLPDNCKLAILQCGINDIRTAHPSASATTPMRIAETIKQCGVELKERSRMMDVVVMGMLDTTNEYDKIVKEVTNLLKSILPPSINQQASTIASTKMNFIPKSLVGVL